MHKPFKQQKITQMTYFHIILNIFLTLSWKKIFKQFMQHAKTLFHRHKLAWQFNNFPYSSGLMLGQVISTIAFMSIFSSNW